MRSQELNSEEKCIISMFKLHKITKNATLSRKQCRDKLTYREKDLHGPWFSQTPSVNPTDRVPWNN